MAVRSGSLCGAALVCLAFACGGCGGGGASDKSVGGARTVVKQFGDDFVHSRFSAACALMTDRAKAEVGNGVASNCPANLGRARSQLPTDGLTAQVARLNSIRITINGNSASVPNLAGGGRTNLTYTGGRWQIDSSSTTGTQ